MTNEILMEGGKAMFVRNEVNTAMLTDIHSKAFIVHTDGTDSGETVNIYKYIHDVSTVVSKHDSFVEYAQKCIVQDIATDAGGAAPQGYTCKVNNVTTTTVKTRYIDLNDSIRFATYSVNTSNELFVLDINTTDSSSLGTGNMCLEKVHAHDFFIHTDGTTSSPAISMLQLYNDASILSKIAVYETDESNEKNIKFYIDTDSIKSREISVNKTASNQPKCVITNDKIAFRNDAGADIEYIQLNDLATGGLNFKGNINALNGTITCNKLLVKYNGGYIDIIEAFSQMLGK